MKLLDLTNDYVFKRIFGRKGNEDITRGFLRAVTKVEYIDINLEDTPILERDLIKDKMGILDVKIVAKEKDKEVRENNIDIEMQVIKSEHIAERILWYWAKLYAGSLERGNGYNTTKKAVCILIADFKLEKLEEIEKYHTKWNIREEEYRSIILTDRLELHIIELEKLEKVNKKTKDEEELLNWCKFIKFPEKVEESIIMKNEEIKKAKEQLDKISQDENERRLAELREKAVRDEMAIRDSGIKEGYKKGLEDGEKKGLVVGEKKGFIKGKKNGALEEKISIAKNMLKANIDKNTISELTGLTVKEIENI